MYKTLGVVLESNSVYYITDFGIWPSSDSVFEDNQVLKLIK